MSTATQNYLDLGDEAVVLHAPGDVTRLRTLILVMRPSFVMHLVTSHGYVP